MRELEGQLNAIWENFEPTWGLELHFPKCTAAPAGAPTGLPPPPLRPAALLLFHCIVCEGHLFSHIVPDSGKMRAAPKVKPALVHAVHAFYHDGDLGDECPD